MMENMDDLDNLMDNFDMKTFWRKKDLAKIFITFGVYIAVGTGIMIKAVLDASDAGAVPQGINIGGDAKGLVIR